MIKKNPRNGGKKGGRRGLLFFRGRTRRFFQAFDIFSVSDAVEGLSRFAGDPLEVVDAEAVFIEEVLVFVLGRGGGKRGRLMVVEGSRLAGGGSGGGGRGRSVWGIVGATISTSKPAHPTRLVLVRHVPGQRRVP